MARKLHNILITGGAGFIGSNFIHYLFGMSSAEGNLFDDANFDGTVVNVVCLTYAGNPENLAEVEKRHRCEGTDEHVNPHGKDEQHHRNRGTVKRRIAQNPRRGITQQQARRRA